MGIFDLLGSGWESFIQLIINLLVYLYGIFGSYGVAIIVFTIITRVVFFPLNVKSMASMREMQVNQARMKPHLDALKKKYGKDRQKLMEEQGKLYQEFGISPAASLGGCLPMTIQMPIWIALYQGLYRLASTPEFAAPFLWIENLGVPETAPWLLIAFTAISQYLLAKMTAQPSGDEQQRTMNRMMQIMMPAMMVYFGTLVPAGLVLYWVVNNIFQFFQQLYTTGWGDLWPSRARPLPVATTRPVSRTVEEGEASDQQDRRAQKAAKREEYRSMQAAQAARASGSVSSRGLPLGQLPETNAVDHGDIRIYTLDYDSSSADYQAEDSPTTTEEAIERVRNPRPARRRRRKK